MEKQRTLHAVGCDFLSLRTSWVVKVQLAVPGVYDNLVGKSR